LPQPGGTLAVLAKRLILLPQRVEQIALARLFGFRPRLKFGNGLLNVFQLGDIQFKQRAHFPLQVLSPVLEDVPWWRDGGFG
jgi:hypothetical protein